MISAEELAERCPLYRKLAQTTLGELFPSPQKVVKLSSTDTVRRAMQVLAEHNILSAPVVDPKDGYLGFVDTLDIVSYVIKGAGEKKAIPTRSAVELSSMSVSGQQLGDDSVKKIIGLSERDPFEPLELSSPANALVELFALGIHRVPLVKDGEIVQIISQSSFCKYLLEHAATMAEIHQLLDRVPRTASKNLGSQLAISKRTDTVLEVLRHINEELVSSVPIVGDDGSIVGSFGASDLRGVFADTMTSLMLPVEQYLQKHSSQAFQPVCSSGEETASQLIQKMLSSTPFRRHRVWITDATKKPVGVFSMTDVMKLIRDTGANEL